MSAQLAAYMRRTVLAVIAQERIEIAAEATYPHDIYRQTVMVTGIDPLHEMSPRDDESRAAQADE